MNSEFQSFYGLGNGFDESTLRQRLDEPLYKEFYFSSDTSSSGNQAYFNDNGN